MKFKREIVHLIITMLMTFISSNGYADSIYSIKLSQAVNNIFSAEKETQITIHDCKGENISKNSQEVIQDILEYSINTTKESCSENKEIKVVFNFKRNGADITHECKLKYDGDTHLINVGISGNESCFNDKPITDYIEYKDVSITDPGIKNNVLQKFSPTINLCDSKKVQSVYKIHTTDTMPMSVEEYLKHVSIHDSINNSIIDTELDSNKLSIISNNQDTSNYYLEAKLPHHFSGPKNLENTPIYVHIKTYTLKIDKNKNAGVVDLQYYFFYAFNNSQYFRSGIDLILKKYTRNWQLDNLAQHQGDWEHITVRLDDKNLRVDELSPNIISLANIDLVDKPSSVFFSAHGKGYWTQPKFEDDTHPIIYSACNSHANYEDARIETLEKITGLGEVLCKAWLTVTDNAEFSSIPWRPWLSANPEKTVIQLGTLGTENWLNYKGGYGPKIINTASAVNGDAKGNGACFTSAFKNAFELAKKNKENPNVLLTPLAKVLSTLDSKTRSGGPRGPSMQKPWNSVE